MLVQYYLLLIPIRKGSLYVFRWLWHSLQRFQSFEWSLTFCIRQTHLPSLWPWEKIKSYEREKNQLYTSTSTWESALQYILVLDSYMFGLTYLDHMEIPIMIGCNILVGCTKYKVMERSPILALFQPYATQPQRPWAWATPRLNDIIFSLTIVISIFVNLS